MFREVALAVLVVCAASIPTPQSILNDLSNSIFQNKAPGQQQLITEGLHHFADSVANAIRLVHLNNGPMQNTENEKATHNHQSVSLVSQKFSNILDGISKFSFSKPQDTKLTNLLAAPHQMQEISKMKKFESNVSGKSVEFGNWYHKIGSDFDMTAQEYSVLPVSEQSKYASISSVVDMVRFQADWPKFREVELGLTYRSDISNVPLEFGKFYHKMGEAFDITKQEFENLPEEERKKFALINSPAELNEYSKDWKSNLDSVATQFKSNFKSDISGSDLLYGRFYHKIGASYDVTLEEWTSLTPEERAKYVLIDSPLQLDQYSADWKTNKSVKKSPLGTIMSQTQRNEIEQAANAAPPLPTNPTEATTEVTTPIATAGGRGDQIDTSGPQPIQQQQQQPLANVEGSLGQDSDNNRENHVATPRIREELQNRNSATEPTSFPVGGGNEVNGVDGGQVLSRKPKLVSGYHTAYSSNDSIHSTPTIPLKFQQDQMRATANIQTQTVETASEVAQQTPQAPIVLDI